MFSERPLPEHVTAPAEYTTLLREIEVMQTHGLHELISDRKRDFERRGIEVSLRSEVQTLFRTVVSHTARRQDLLPRTDFIEGSRRYYTKYPILSLVLERPTAGELLDIRGIKYAKQPVLAYVVSALPSRSLLFARETRMRYDDPNLLRVVLGNPQEMMRLRPFEQSHDAIQEGLSKLFYESPFRGID